MSIDEKPFKEAWDATVNTSAAPEDSYGWALWGYQTAMKAMTTQQPVEITQETGLKTCPFCGSPGVLDDSTADRTVVCSECGAQPRHLPLHHDQTKREAYAVWNKRATREREPQQPEQLAKQTIEKLKSASFGAIKGITVCDGVAQTETEQAVPLAEVFLILAQTEATSLPERESGNRQGLLDSWQPLETAPPGYTKDKGFEHILFKGYSKAGSFTGNVYVSGWMDNDRKPVYEYSYKLVITGWKPLSAIEEQGRRGRDV